MAGRSVGMVAQPDEALRADLPKQNMVFIPGGMFRTGPSRHYPEEAPVHRVTVDGFWIDRAPVINREFRKFVNDVGDATFAEIKPNAEGYPGALPAHAEGGIADVVRASRWRKQWPLAGTVGSALVS